MKYKFFCASWCKKCAILWPHALDRYRGEIEKIDIELDPRAQEYQIMTLPTLVGEENDKVVMRLDGDKLGQLLMPKTSDN